MGKFTLEDTGDPIVMRLEGKLEYEDYRRLQVRFLELAKGQGKIRALVIADKFQGWGREGDWGDLALQEQLDTAIHCMAIVCGDEWRDSFAMFAGQGMRPFPVEIFPPSDAAKAQVWLDEPQ
jgi:hypothetical protein